MLVHAGVVFLGAEQRAVQLEPVYHTKYLYYF